MYLKECDNAALSREIWLIGWCAFVSNYIFWTVHGL